MQKTKSGKRSAAIVHSVFYMFLSAGALICLYPIIFTVLAGFFTAEEFIQRMPDLSFFPIAENPTLMNFTIIFRADNTVATGFLNSLLRTSYAAVTTVITGFISGYVFARLRFRGKKALFMIILGAAMLPATVTLIPSYIMYARWPFAGGNNIFTGGKGILNSYWVYLIGGPSIPIMATFIIMQSFVQIPKEMDEAARIDGAGTFTLLVKILLPLQKSILTYVAVTTALAAWNDWMTPFFFASSDQFITLPGAIVKLSANMTGFAVPNYPLLIILGLMTTIPCMIIFFIFQRYLVEGLANVGIKG